MTTSHARLLAALYLTRSGFADCSDEAAYADRADALTSLARFVHRRASRGLDLTDEWFAWDDDLPADTDPREDALKDILGGKEPLWAIGDAIPLASVTVRPVESYGRPFIHQQRSRTTARSYFTYLFGLSPTCDELALVEETLEGRLDNLLFDQGITR